MNEEDPLYARPNETPSAQTQNRMQASGTNGKSQTIKDERSLKCSNCKYQFIPEIIQ